MSIILRSRRGAIGTRWHAVALREGAEQLLGPARVGRGKADARAGRVQWLDVEAGIVRGDVLDAEGELHQARLDLPAFRPDDRRAFLQVARSHPELPARMAGGDYPQGIEAELAASEISLLPRDASELTHDCSCLDWPGPCRHVGALVYVLVEAVDDAPALLLTLRGLALEDLVAPAGPGPGGVTPGEGTVPNGAEEADGAEADGDGPEQPEAPVFDPARTDPARLAEVVGEDVAAVIHRFYTDAS
ncbi:SWIM zinc finger family protein [Brachybacterium sp. AOP43-C2-M15]|uniref:SWIM zinc finger family protein n=1 Tax=Brachybacterium sp. AOP43-C2-M15 TaxID=3457661 RepID=UPI004033A5E1